MRDRKPVRYESQNISDLATKDVARLIKQQYDQLHKQLHVTSILYDNNERGDALVAKTNLPKGFELPYYGKVVDGYRLRKLKLSKRAQTHTLEVDQDLAVVGKFKHAKEHYTSLGAFATHSIIPNMEIRTDDFDFPVLRALRPIQKDEKLTIDYGPNFFVRKRSFQRGPARTETTPNKRRRPRGRAPSGKDWDAIRGRWIVKRPRGRAPAYKSWDYEHGRWIQAAAAGFI